MKCPSCGTDLEPDAKFCDVCGADIGTASPAGAGEVVVTIGRESDNMIAIDAEMISRYHARVRISGTTLFIEDLGSANGTSVNGSPVKSSPFNLSDTVTFGSFRFDTGMLMPYLPAPQPTAAPAPALKPTVPNAPGAPSYGGEGLKRRLLSTGSGSPPWLKPAAIIGGSVLLVAIVVIFVFRPGSRSTVEEIEAIIDEQLPLIEGDNPKADLLRWCTDNSERVENVMKAIDRTGPGQEKLEQDLEELEQSIKYQRYRNALRNIRTRSRSERRTLRRCVIH